VRTARAKGLAGTRVGLRASARNALLSFTRGSGWLLALPPHGARTDRNHFRLVGDGSVSPSCDSLRDYPVVTGTALIASVLVVTGNLLADILLGSPIRAARPGDGRCRVVGPHETLARGSALVVALVLAAELVRLLPSAACGRNDGGAFSGTAPRPGVRILNIPGHRALGAPLIAPFDPNKQLDMCTSRTMHRHGPSSSARGVSRDVWSRTVLARACRSQSAR